MILGPFMSCSSNVDVVLEENVPERSRDKFYANVHVSAKEDAMCHAIGRRGRHFNRIRQHSGADQLVYNKHRGVVHVYGASDTLGAATEMLRARCAVGFTVTPAASAS